MHTSFVLEHRIHGVPEQHRGNLICASIDAIHGEWRSNLLNPSI